MDLSNITKQLNSDLKPLSFGFPVSHVYNPLIYAARPYQKYLELSGQGPKEVVLVGMNPGPWGMAQTGVPFGEIETVRDWFKIEATIDQPERSHSKRPVTGLSCKRREVSGRRLWGWAKAHFDTPEAFFARFWVANYCPLLFMEKSGRNRTPNQLPVAERRPLLAVCDAALRRSVEVLGPKYVVGIGNFAFERVATALSGMNVTVGRITHPSPANPKANRGWVPLIEKELADLGVNI